MLFFSPPMQFNLNAAAGGGATYNFALWGAGGAGGAGATSIAIGVDGGCGGGGAMIEFTAAGVPAGMEFELIRGGGGGAGSNSSNGGVGGGAGAASMIIATYNSTSVLLAVAGAGGGGGGTGGGGNTTSIYRGGSGGGGAEVDGSRNDGTDIVHNGTVNGGHGGTSTTSGVTVSYVNGPAKETYAQDGGDGGQGGSTSVAGWTGDGKLPAGYESYGGAGGKSGNKSVADGGGGGGGGGYFSASGGEGCHDPSDRRGGAGGGGGGSYLNSGTIDVGGASLTITLVQTIEGRFRTSSGQPALTQTAPAALFDGTTTAYGRAGDGGDKSADVNPTDGQNGAIIYGTSATDAVTLYDATRLGYRDTFVV